MNILIQPVITEKQNQHSEKMNAYGFLVNPAANKIQIKIAVEKAYGVTVNSVNTMNYYGKTKVRYTKKGFLNGRKPQYKKAVVHLKAGDKIDFFSNI